jgi:hypothetical protein
MREAKMTWFLGFQFAQIQGKKKEKKKKECKNHQISILCSIQ